MASSSRVAPAVASSSYGSLKKVRLWSQEFHLDWTLDLSKVRDETELKEMIASQFGRSSSAFFSSDFSTIS